MKLRSLGPWAHQTHLSFPDIEQLGELVQRCPPQYTPYGSNARVVVDAPYSAGVLFGIRDHGPKLEYSENASVSAHSLLAEEDWSLVLQPDSQGDNSPEQGPQGCQKEMGGN